MTPWLLPIGAVAAGVVSAASPCVIPVLPGFVATLSDDIDRRRSRVVGTLGFTAGFSLVFAALGATASAIGDALFTHLGTLQVASGLVLIVLGLHTSRLLTIGVLERERSMLASRHARPARSVTVGAAFAVGWTPCIGPILAAILTKAAERGSLTEGVMLLLLYSAGLAIPFLIAAIWLDRWHAVRAILGRRSSLLQRLSGITMIVVGVGYVTGIWSIVFTGVQRQLVEWGWPPI